MVNDNTTKDRLKEITDSIEQGIKELFQSDKYIDYLRTMSRFHRYSLNNTLLISMQKPDATHVAGFNKWRDQFSRNVKKGEKGIKIIAPTPYKVKKEMEKLDPVTQSPMLNTDGKVITEEVEVKIPLYRVVSVFDVSQTEGKPLPELASNLTGDVKQYELFMEALSRSAPVPISFEKMDTDTDGYFSSQNQKIAIREGMSEVQTVSALIHEIAHSKLHDRTKQQAEVAQLSENTEPPKPKDRRTEEVEAESISFAVCQYYGIQTGENSFGYIATWSKDKELPELRASLETINKTASGLIEDIDRNFSELIKEKGIDLTPEHLAYEVGELYFSIQETEGGYDYSIYDKDYNLLDGGVYDDPDISIYEAMDNIVEDDPVNGIAALKDRANAKQINYDELTEKADTAFQERVNPTPIDINSSHIKIEGHIGTWYAIDSTQMEGKDYFLLEHEDYGDEAACLIVTQQGEVVLDDVWNGFGDLEEHFAATITPENTGPIIEELSYPLPDPDMSLADRNAYGYLDNEMLPLSQARAVELFEQDLTIYLLYKDNTEAMAFDREDIDNHNGIFGMERADWIALQGFEEIKGDGKLSPEIWEQLFMESSYDTYAIYQLKDGDETRDYRFEGLKRLQKSGLSVEHEHYELVYTAPLTDFNENKAAALEHLYEQFNLNHPADFKGHSLSVSDIVALKVGDTVSSHYVDSIGFAELPQFLEPTPLSPDDLLTGEMIDTPRGSFSLTSMTREQMSAAGYGFHHASDDGAYHIMGNGTRAFAIRNEDNPLRTAELSTEQNYNQIDGVLNNQPTVAELEKDAKSGKSISLMDLLDATRMEQKANPPQKKEKTAPPKGAEMEL